MKRPELVTGFIILQELGFYFSYAY